jgi:hypothetical protein
MDPKWYLISVDTKKRSWLPWARMYQWKCSCGARGQFWYSREGRALLYGFQHRVDVHLIMWLGSYIGPWAKKEK